MLTAALWLLMDILLLLSRAGLHTMSDRERAQRLGSSVWIGVMLLATATYSAPVWQGSSDALQVLGSAWFSLGAFLLGFLNGTQGLALRVELLLLAATGPGGISVDAKYGKGN